MFDYEQTSDLSFTEFLHGMSLFTKRDQETQIKKLFQIYDDDKTGFVTKEEFLKMLYNYPKQNLHELFNLVNLNAGDENKKQMLGEFGKSFSIMESQANFLFKNLDQSRDSKQNNNGLKNMPSLTRKSFELDGNPLKQIPLPTSLNNKMKLMTNLIFQVHGDEGKMYFDEFKKWVKLHPKFLKSIQEWFRPSLWKMKKTSKDGVRQPGFSLLKPDFEADEQIQRFHSMQKMNAHIRIYDVFLFVFINRIKEIPDKIFVLKGLDISYNDQKRKIFISSKTRNYQGIKIVFKEDNVFKKWKEYFNRYEMDYQIHQYKILQKVGKGAFSVVSKVQKISTGEIFALKYIEKSHLTNEEIKVIENEISIMKIINHKHIVNLIDGWQGFNSFNYILDFIDGVDLYEYVTEKGPLDETIVRRIICILLDVLKTIHMAGVIHRDLKPDNIMICLKNNKITDLKLIDFGFAIFHENISQQTPRAGTLTFMSPEMIKGEKYDFQSDIFSLGVIMYFILTGELPFYSEEEELIARKIIEGDYDLDSYALRNVSDEAKDMIKNLIENDPAKRITINDAFQHPFINKKISFPKQNGQNENMNKKENPEIIDDSFDLQKFVQFIHYLCNIRQLLKSPCKLLLIRFAFIQESLLLRFSAFSL